MRFTRLRLENWRNFTELDLQLQQRVFLVGPNAAGKSNLLDAFRFLRDIAEPQGGLVRAVNHPNRRGISQIRSLHARRQPNVVVDVEVELPPSASRRKASGNGSGQSSTKGDTWRYRLELGQDNQRRPMVRRELVERGGQKLLDRPDEKDREDEERLTQTYLEQVNANQSFRSLADAFSRIRYLHLVPQLVREPERSLGRSRDPFGGDFLEQLARTPEKTRTVRLGKIRDALEVAVPQLKELKLERDERGIPHLKGRYEHWRPNAGWQTEEQFSDGTLRLLGLLWVFLDGREPLLLEEPELSLHTGVVRHLSQIFFRLGRTSGRQLLISTHSRDLLNDPGIGADEIVLLVPAKEGTQATLGTGDTQICDLLEAGLAPADAVLAATEPKRMEQLLLFPT